jgi:hypothetical protein
MGFQPGNPGRPKGTRVRITNAFFNAVLDEFDRRGVVALRELDSAKFIDVVSRLVPAQLEIDQETTVYVLTDRAISSDEWAAKYSDPPLIEARPIDDKVH